MVCDADKARDIARNLAQRVVSGDPAIDELYPARDKAVAALDVESHPHDVADLLPPPAASAAASAAPSSMPVDDSRKVLKRLAGHVAGCSKRCAPAPPRTHSTPALRDVRQEDDEDGEQGDAGRESLPGGDESPPSPGFFERALRFDG